MPTRLQKAFGAKIRKLRAAADFSQEMLSEKTGISTQHISNLENGHRQPCLGNMAKLAKAFGVSLPELLQGVDSR